MAKFLKAIFWSVFLICCMVISGCGKSASQLTIDGQKLYEQKQYEAAINCYKLALERNPPLGDWATQGTYDNLKWRIGVNYLLWSAKQRASGNVADADDKPRQAMQCCPPNGQDAMFHAGMQSASDDLIRMMLNGSR